MLLIITKYYLGSENLKMGFICDYESLIKMFRIFIYLVNRPIIFQYIYFKEEKFQISKTNEGNNFQVVFSKPKIHFEEFVVYKLILI